MANHSLCFYYKLNNQFFHEINIVQKVNIDNYNKNQNYNHVKLLIIKYL